MTYLIDSRMNANTVGHPYLFFSFTPSTTSCVKTLFELWSFHVARIISYLYHAKYIAYNVWFIGRKGLHATFTVHLSDNYDVNAFFSNIAEMEIASLVKA